MTKISLLFVMLAVSAIAQTPAVAFPTFPLPMGVSAFGEFNQLGSSRFNLGISADYAVAGSIGIYGSTTADIFPKLSVDPATKRQFYAMSTSIRQGLHKDIFDTGHFSFLLGGDVGPSFSQSSPSGINLDFSSSFVFTSVYQVSPAVSLILPFRGLYVKDIGWNPIVEFGVRFNLKNLQKK